MLRTATEVPGEAGPRVGRKSCRSNKTSQENGDHPGVATGW